MMGKWHSSNIRSTVGLSKFGICGWKKMSEQQQQQHLQLYRQRKKKPKLSLDIGFHQQHTVEAQPKHFHSVLYLMLDFSPASPSPPPVTATACKVFRQYEA